MFEQVIDDERGWQRMVLVPRGARPEGVSSQGGSESNDRYSLLLFATICYYLLLFSTLCYSVLLFATLYYSLLLLCYVYDESQELIAT